MKLIPILFSTPMVQGILSENKSMTRRTKGLELASIYASSCKRFDAGAFLFSDKHSDAISLKRCPYGQPGDVLWVREKFCNINKPDIDPEFVYFTETIDAEDYDPKEWKWKPSIHMPFEACRTFLRVKEIRVERLHDINTADIVREGVQATYTNPKMGLRHDNAMIILFATLWVNINGADSWNANPWVWVIAFERITDENEIAAIRKQWNERRAK